MSVLMLLQIMSNSLHCSCLNNAPGKTHVKSDGKGKKTYICKVKNTEQINFDEHNNCKKCGCHVSDHDNT